MKKHYGFKRFLNDIKIHTIGIAYVLAGSPHGKNLVMIGHRGYSAKHVDNTAESFIAAAKHGSHGVETDVRVTKDGVLVLSHDSFAKFADGSTLVVADSTYEELIKKPLLNTRSADTVYLCTLKRYFEICKQYNLVCFVELKGGFSDNFIKKAFNMAIEEYDLKMCSLQSDDLDNLIRARRLFSDLQIMLTYGRNDRDRGVDYKKCFDYGFDIDADFTLASRKMVEEFHSRGLKFGVWTCNIRVALNYGYWLRADYIESNVF